MRHDIVSGCKTSFLRKEVRDPKKPDGVVLIFKCHTHDVEICKCGHEWGKHPDKKIELNYLESFLDFVLNKK